MSFSNERLLSIYNSRTNLLDILGSIGYHVADYAYFTPEEVEAMVQHSQLDMLISHSQTKAKVYVKYLSGSKTTKAAVPKTIGEVVEELFELHGVLAKTDTLIVVMDNSPSDPLIDYVKYMYDHDGYFVVLHHINSLQFNILEHQLVPPTRVLTETETAEVMKKYNIQRLDQFPEISRFDPVALAICMRPKQVCEILRPSPTAIKTKFYRVCV